MKTGAVITAAGMSSRMGDFKPLMKIGSISMIERIVSTFKTAGIDFIVVVTGNQACKIEKSMKPNGIVLLKNENYETTDMFASVKIGLEYLKDKCDQYIITPVDIPLFKSDTVIKLVKSCKTVCCPQNEGRRGHPLVLSKGILQNVLNYTGNDGLRGAINCCKCKIDTVDVDDKGILFDADTMEDYKNIVEIHNSNF